MYPFSLRAAESRLLRLSSLENASEGNQQVPEITESLATLNKGVYEKMITSTTKTGIDATQSASIRVESVDGSVEIIQKKPGTLIQREKNGYLMLIGRNVRFVPDASFQGTVRVMENGVQLSSKELTGATDVVSMPKEEVKKEGKQESSEVAKPSSQTAEVKEAPVPKTVTNGPVTLHLTPQVQGIMDENGKTLTFLPSESGTIKNALGSLTRRSAQDTMAVFVPSPNLKGKIFAGTQLIYGSNAVPSPKAETPRTPPPVRRSEPRSRQQPRTQKNNKAPQPRFIPETVIQPDVGTTQKVSEVFAYLKNPNAYTKLPPLTRNFLELYTEFWQQADRSGAIGRRLWNEPSFKRLQASIKENSYPQSTVELEKIAEQVMKVFAEAMLGKENDQQEYRSYVLAYNARIQSGGARSVEEAAKQIYDQRSISSPRERFHEKNGRLPAYRSSWTNVVIGYRNKMQDAYVRLANANESTAEGYAKDYRRNEYAFRALRHQTLKAYENDWTTRERRIVTGSTSEAKNSTLDEQVRAQWHRHRNMDTLMMEEKSREELVENRTKREQAEKRLRRLAPDSPSGF